MTILTIQAFVAIACIFFGLQPAGQEQGVTFIADRDTSAKGSLPA